MCLDARNGHFFQIIRELLGLEPEYSHALMWGFSSYSFTKRYEEMFRFVNGYRKKTSRERFRKLMDCSELVHFEAQCLLDSFNFDYSMTVLEFSHDSISSRTITRRDLSEHFAE